MLDKLNCRREGATEQWALASKRRAQMQRYMDSSQWREWAWNIGGTLVHIKAMGLKFKESVISDVTSKCYYFATI